MEPAGTPFLSVCSYSVYSYNSVYLSGLKIGAVGTGGGAVSVAVDGRYAYVVTGDFDGTLQVVDVSKPSAPVSVGSVTTGNYPSSVAVAGRYAYVVNNYSSTLQVFEALWQNLWVKMAHPKGRQASPLRGGDRRRRELGLGSRRRRSPACPWDVGVS